MKVYCLLMSALCVWITPARSQFFYSHYTAPFAPVFAPPAFVPAVPKIAFAPPVVPYHLHQNVQRKAASTTVRYNLPPAQPSEYLGFGYRTEYQDGASSTVFFVTGPESENLRNFKDFPNFSRKFQESTDGKARSIASDITDLNAVPNPQNKIQSILQPSEFQRLFESVRPGVINFYTYPASTVPLIRGSLNGSESEVSTTTTSSTTNEEAVAAESVLNPKIFRNGIENTDKPNDVTTTTSTTTTTTTEASTEAVENPTTETSEEPTPTTVNSNDEATTVETTTQV